MKKYKFEIAIISMILIILLQPIYALNEVKNEKKELINFNTIIELIWKRDPGFIKIQEEIIDKFPMKVYSVKLISEFEYRLFGKSNNVIVGLDGYLTDKVVAQQLITLDEMELNTLRESANRLSVINQYLEKQNKKFIVVIVPLKPTIYSEKYPGPLAERKNIGLVRFQQQLESMNIEYVDLYKPLLANKNKYGLFYKTDVHWNTVGVAFAAEAIVNHLSNLYLNLGIFNEKFSESVDPFIGGESTSMGLVKPLSEKVEKFISTTLDYEVTLIDSIERFTSINPQKSLLPKTIMFGNSFMLNYRNVGMQNYFKQFDQVLDYTSFKDLSKFINDEHQIVILHLYETQVLFHLIEGDQSSYWPNDILEMNS